MAKKSLSITNSTKRQLIEPNKVNRKRAQSLMRKMGIAAIYPKPNDGFTKILIDAEIKISMDDKGRALDNVFVERLWRSVKYD